MAKTVATKAGKAASVKPSAKTVFNGNGSSKNGAATEKFVAAKTGRIVKPSPAEPLLGRARIRAAVREVVRRDAVAVKAQKVSG